MLVSNGSKMKIDEKEQPEDNDWKRVFKVLPVKTEDGVRVMCKYVWMLDSDDPFEPVRYHTNPDGKETAWIVKTSYEQMMGDNILPVGSNPPPMPKVKRPRPPPPPPGRKIKAPQPLQQDVVEAVEKAIEFSNDRQLKAIKRIVAEQEKEKRRTHGTGPR